MVPTTAVYVQRENDKGVIQGFARGKLTADDLAGTITVDGKGLLAGQWSVVIRPEQVTQFAIIMLDDVGQMGMMYGGGLIGYGVAWIMSRWVKMPALRIEQSNAAPGNRVATLRGLGFQPRVATRKLMNQVADFLTQKGYKGAMPDLADETPWKFPWVPVLIGFGAVALLVCLAIVCLVAVTSNGTGQ